MLLKFFLLLFIIDLAFLIPLSFSLFESILDVSFIKTSTKTEGKIFSREKNPFGFSLLKTLQIFYRIALPKKITNTIWFTEKLLFKICLKAVIFLYKYIYLISYELSVSSGFSNSPVLQFTTPVKFFVFI